MLHLKKLLLLLSASIMAASLAHAAVRSIADVDVFTDRDTQGASGSANSLGDDSHTSTYSGVECGNQSADTPEGCNQLLGISNAVATACDGGRYNCSEPANPIPLDAYPTCDIGAVDDSSQCAASTNSEQCQTADGAIKYNCRCKSEYVSCEASTYGDPDGKCVDSAGVSFYQQCLPACPSGHTIETSQAACQYALNRNNAVKCYNTSTDTVGYDCTPECSVFEKATPQYSIQSQTDCTSSSINGEIKGLCYSEGIQKAVCGCNTSEYVSNCGGEPVCEDEKRPLGTPVCRAENDPTSGSACEKMSTLCGYPECSDTERTPLNMIYLDLQDSYTEYSEETLKAAAEDCSLSTFGVSSLYKDYPGKKKPYMCTAQTSIASGVTLIATANTAAICGCEDQYKYTPFGSDDNFLAQNSLEKVNQAPSADYVSPISVSRSMAEGKKVYKIIDVCAWDAQTSKEVRAINLNSSGHQLSGSIELSKTIDLKRLRYKNPPIRICQDWEEDIIAYQQTSEGQKYAPTGGETPCIEGGQVASCAMKVDLTEAEKIVDGGIYALNQDVSYYEKVSYCTCPKDEDGNDLWKTSCEGNLLRGGRQCKMDGPIKFELCLPKCYGSTDAEADEGPEYVGLDNGVDDLTVSCGNLKQKVVGSYDPVEGADNSEFYNNNQKYLCLSKDADTGIYWQCNCGNYKTNEECNTLTEGMVGADNICLYESTETGNIIKYENCLYPCPEGKSAYLSESQDACKYMDFDGSTKCYQAAETEGELGKTLYQCQCPTYVRSLLEECGGQITDTQTVCDNACQKCYTEQKIGLDSEACTFDALDDNGEVLEYLKKYSFFGDKCSWFEQEAGQGTLKIVEQQNGCGNWVGGTALTSICYEPNGDSAPKSKYICGCPSNYQTLTEYCSLKVAAGETDIDGEVYTQASCEAAFKGIGVPCSYDVVDGQNVDKYRDFGISCPEDANRVKGDKSECNIGDYEGSSSVCYKDGNEGIANVVCGCPKEFDTKCYTDEGQNILDTNKIRGGLSCTFDGEPKYEKCLPQCENTVNTPVVLDPDSCPLVDGVQADTGEMCFNKYGDETAMYVCRCPKSQGYKTIEEYCSSQKDENGTSGIYYQGRFFTSTECKSRFIGVGEACTFDGNGSVKYKSFSVVCPTDRPLYYSADECTSTSMPGSLDYYCYESSNLLQQRVVCKCPETWVDVSGNRKVDGVDTRVCADTEEAAGQTCSFEGTKNLKYEKCYTRCDKMDTNGKGVSYLEEEEAYELDCKNLLGDGATFGVDGLGGQCSQNHTLAYPCYCGSSYTEQCLNDENKTPAPGALACTVGGATYYEECANNDCAEESATVAIIDDINTSTDPSILCQNAGFGPGASGKRCGEKKIECTCDARDYTETCDYPYEKPDTTEVSWCKYGNGSTLMKNGVAHFRPGECRVKPILAQCGKHILNDDGTPNTSYTINIASTESQCKALYGTGVKAQLCEYTEDPNKRAYNCYYDPSEFKWTEENCPVRHILGDNYIIKGGVRYYDKCDCHPAYTNHKYNCAGMLSGGACSLQLTAEKISSDSTLRRAAQEGLISTKDTLSFYPYCQCTSDYNQECDGERYIGVGEPCNGKYKACECKPDELPANWADNYYGCPGGKKPTGVTKPNGCGGKYYQCEVTACTWQHTEKCLPPLIGVDPCQDNEGNIGGYKSCRCPDGYAICPEGTVGTGEPCMLNGQYYYKEGSCVSKETCTHGENQTCQGSLQIGVNPCTRNGITYFEYCICASGYDKPCNGDNEVGIGTYCTLNGTKYYTECATPSSSCTNEHREACDTNQSSYDPCVSADNEILYKCKCPTNWKTCASTGPGTNAESCTDSSGTYYSSCAVSNECSSYQEQTYSVCTDSQVGTGGSCVSVNGETQVTKYAQCEETSACKLNGYQYTCQGYDQGGLGDSCVDEMGNRLYKSCGCPENWVECPGKNNTKGRSCTPLRENGSLGTTVYESCTCDKSIYKTTCEATGANQGVIPSKSRSCTEVIYGEGEQPTYYESCECSSSYKYTCTANGQLKDDDDYCQKTENGEKLYTHCECDSDYSETCAYDASNPGMTKPQDANKACTPLNSETGDNSTKYSGCECGQYYTETCSDPNHLKVDAYKCTANGIDKFNQCDCPSAFAYSCQPSGQNKGIKAPSLTGDQSCTQIKYVNSVRTATTLYSECECQSSYKYSCNASDDDGQGLNDEYTSYSYYVTSSNYCERYVSSGEGEAASSVLQRRFEECLCNSSFVSACDGENEQPPADGAFCLQVDKNGKTQKLYQACQCRPVDMSGWTSSGIIISATAGEQTFDQSKFNAMDSGNQESLKNILNSACEYYKNAELKLDGCGQIYYKCLSSYGYYKDTSAGNITNCNANDSTSQWVPQGNSKSVAGTLGNITMYEICDCDPDKYTKDDSCSEVGNFSRTGGYKPACWIFGHDKGSDKDDIHEKYRDDYTCNKISENYSNISGKTPGNTSLVPALTNSKKNACKTRSGELLYNNDDCDCNLALFSSPEDCRYWDGDQNGNWIEYGAYCKRRDGTVRCYRKYFYTK